MFRNRNEAARKLAVRLQPFSQHPDLLVLGLPRGGVPIARVVAEELQADLDVCLVRKLGVPWEPELALGAVAEGGVRVLDSELIRKCDLDPPAIEELIQEAQREIDRRGKLYRIARPRIDVRDREVVVVDDGLATGSTMLAAIQTLRARGARRIIVAVPVAPPSTCQMLRRQADDVVCLETHEPFHAVGNWYANFTQVTEAEVQQALAEFHSPKE